MSLWRANGKGDDKLNWEIQWQLKITSSATEGMSFQDGGFKAKDGGVTLAN